VSSKTDRKRNMILDVLRSASGPVSSPDLSALLTARGLDVSERTARLYLAELRDEGLTAPVGRRGHRLTEAGLAELRASSVFDRVGLLSARIDEMTYRMNFDLSTRRGTVVVNTSIASLQALEAGMERICQVFARGYAMGELLTLLGPGERLGELVVPEGRVGFCTVCSITINGVLLKHGIPTRSRFGGLLELVDGQATRFVELITYDGTTIDPLEVFIRSGMTNYLGAISTGHGRVGAGFREVPAESRDTVLLLADRLQRVGMGAILEVGWSGRPLLGIPVGEGHAGVVVIGGLNPVSILEEMGHRAESRALSGLLEFNRLFHYSELPDRLAELAR
jgi:HTH-type transcriptional regulator, global nitrogen regulator NrpRI